ncbi:phosphogluconate dehydrogenase (NAD(+)-dependent, decarboxylating) [Aquipuribacter nitratireducens]|uniref:Phosphogluconate dehydrogenase (NAD(+)-dependent, decarboxylating) n=1 Tax=Aquipuribacter nitratireducens TaxID=650104 RepID=A0ABW0GQN1_9MICO
MSDQTAHPEQHGNDPVRHLGLVGLGKMGGNMRTRLREAGLEVTGYAPDPTTTDVETLEDLVAALPRPRTVWVMVPSGDPTRQTVERLGQLLEPGDLVIEGGNSRWTDDREHAAHLAERGVRYVDCGVSGGIWGVTEGYGLMAGGDPADIERALPVFDALRPEGPREEGFSHAGPVGAGHYAKMVHNGIEYAVMQAFAEGYELLDKTDVVDDVATVFAGWRRGTVVRSWLLDLLVRALEEDPGLTTVSGYAEDSGEGRWTVIEGIENAVATPTIAASLYARFVSRQEESPAMKAIAALRNQFGGHTVRSTRPGSAEQVAESAREGAAAEGEPTGPA